MNKVNYQEAVDRLNRMIHSCNVEELPFHTLSLTTEDDYSKLSIGLRTCFHGVPTETFYLEIILLPEKKEFMGEVTYNDSARRNTFRSDRFDKSPSIEELFNSVSTSMDEIYKKVRQEDIRYCVKRLSELASGKK